MGTRHGFERLVFFTDAVTAIAITLLILPLVELVPDYAKHSDATVGGFIHDNWTPIWSFLLSFVIIARLWIANHKVLEPVERQSRSLMVLEIGWAFTIVVLPLPTALISGVIPDRSSVALYIGTMTTGSLFLTALSWVVYRHPELGASDRQRSITTLYGVASNAGAFALALIIGVAFPQVNYFALLLLVLTIPLDWIVKPRLRAATAHLAPPQRTTDAPTA